MTDTLTIGSRWRRARWRTSAAGQIAVNRPWLAGVAISLGMAALGVALGLIPGLASDGWTTSRANLDSFIGFTATAIVSLAIGATLWRQKERLLTNRGSVFVVEEIGAGWTHENKRAFLAAMTAQFAAVHTVAGPAALDNWPWPTDRDLDQWNTRVDDLVRAFRALNADDDSATPRSVYLWALWPVAAAFAARVAAQEQGLRLRIRQRPSDARAGYVEPAQFRDNGHTFHQRAEEPLAGKIKTFEHPIRLTVNATPQQASGKPVTVLLLRSSERPWAGIGATPSAEPVDVQITDGAGLGLTTSTLTIHEWRYEPRGEHIPWAEMPTVVSSACDWICRQAAANPEAIILLGSTMPQEFNAGLGAQSAKRPTQWPEHLWPLVVARVGNTALPTVVPKLDLGRTTLDGRSEPAPLVEQTRAPARS